MAVLDQGLFHKLAELKEKLDTERRTTDRDTLRSLLTSQIGTIKELRIVCAGDLKQWSGNRPLLAVDGSVNKTGAAFPYIICFFQAFAKCSTGGGAAIADYFTPLSQTDYHALQEFGDLHEAGYDHALNLYQECRLCALEIESALMALTKYDPFLVIFDGSFLRFSRYAPDLWNRFRQESLARGVLSVGVIEEAASFGLYRNLSADLDSGIGLTGELPFYDRELFFGLLSKGECFFPNVGMELKKEYFTVFARLSNVPQAIACDFFREQAPTARLVMDYLYTISPDSSRGIPLFLDLVDAETRLSNNDVKLLLESNLSAELLERFYKTNRARRDF